MSPYKRPPCLRSIQLDPGLGFSLRRAARKVVRAESAKTAETWRGEAQGIADQSEALYILHISALLAVFARKAKEAGPRIKSGETMEEG